MNTRALAVIVALTAIPYAARADEPPPSAPVAYCCEPPSIWTGVYIGGHVGASWGDPTWTFPFLEAFNTAPGQNFSATAQGAIAGGQIGVNYQISHFLMGVEASYAGSRFSYTVVGPIVNPTDRFTVDTSDLLMGTGRLGFVHGQYLFYGKAGYANANVEVKAARSTAITASASHREGGWTVGGGLESRIISNIIFGLEYNYVSLPGDRFTTVTGGTLPSTAFNADIDSVHMHTVVARLSILFGPHACCGEGVLGKW